MSDLTTMIDSILRKVICDVHDQLLIMGINVTKFIAKDTVRDKISKGYLDNRQQNTGI